MSEVSIDTLRRELEDAFRSRAHLYRAIYDELAASLGPAAAERHLARAIEARGREVGRVLAKACAPGAQAVGDKFLSVSPDGGRMYPCAVERRAGGMTVRVARCPLKDAWTEAGLAPERIAQMCRIAGAFDKGLFEAAGVRFSNETWNAERGGGCCWIHLDD